MVELRHVYGQTIAELGDEVPNIVVLDADLSGSTRTALFRRRHPERFYDMGVAEQDMMATAAGLALGGFVPIVSSFAIFAVGRAWEQLRNSVCYANLDVKIVATHAGVSVGPDGGSHQAIEDVALTRAIPKLRVIAPCDARQTRQVIRAVVASPGPCYVRLPRGSADDVHDDSYRFELGRATTLRAGRDVAIVACGPMVGVALSAAAQLAERGVDATVVDSASIKPLDEQAIVNAARACGRVVTVEEHTVIGGLGSAVCEALAGHSPAPVLRLGIDDRFGESGTPDELLELHGLTPERVSDAVASFVRAG